MREHPDIGLVLGVGEAEMMEEGGELPCSSDMQPHTRPAYCPSRYADPLQSGEAVKEVATSSAARATKDRVAQLRSRLRAVQQAAGAAGGGEGGEGGGSGGGGGGGGGGGVQATRPGTLPKQPPPQVPSRQASSPGSPAEVSSTTTAKSTPSPSRNVELLRSQPLSDEETGPVRDKLSSILSFLDEVEGSSRAEVRSSSSSARSSLNTPQDYTFNNVAGSAAEFQSRISVLEAEVHDKKKAISSLKTTLAEMRDRCKQAIQDAAKEWDAKLQHQKSHYEASLERQLKLVDRLLNDKSELTKRCELFAEELKAAEKKFQMKLEEHEEQAAKDIARQKQNWSAAERLRREAWEKEKVREIKEMTIKGLQPEVERILAERKQERLKMEDRHKEEFETLRRDMQDNTQLQLRELREQLSREHEQSLDRERDAHRRKLREEFERCSAQLQEERSKCAADLLAECRRHEQQLQQELEKSEGQTRDALAAERKRAEGTLTERQQKLKEMEEKHKSELQGIEERFQAEREELQREQQESARLEREALRSELAQERETQREELIKERDKQLELLVDKLSREHVEQQRGVKEESAALLAQARVEAKSVQERSASQAKDAQERAAALEGRLQEAARALESLQAQLERELACRSEMEAHFRALEDQRSAERFEAEQTLERQQAELRAAAAGNQDAVTGLQEELRQANARVAEEHGRLDEQRREHKKREERLIDDLEARVKRALQAKDVQISELKTRWAASENQVREFEYLLARQREELLSGLAREALGSAR